MSWNLIANADRRKEEETVLLRPAAGGDLRVAIGYPNSYRVGMSNLGMQIIYGIFNGIPGVSCERFFLPDPEEIELYRRNGRRLFTLESQRPLCEYDVLAFTVAYEQDYVNLVQILDLAGVPLLGKQRDDRHPLVLVGGPITMLNPEPLADFVDVFCLGEGEDVVAPFTEVLRGHAQHLHTPSCLQDLARVPGLYVPSLWQPVYENGGVVAWRSLVEGRADYQPRLGTADTASYQASSIISSPVEAMSSPAILVDSMPADAANPMGASSGFLRPGVASSWSSSACPPPENYLADRSGAVAERHVMSAATFAQSVSASHILTADTELGFSGLTEISRGCYYSCRFCTVGHSYTGARWKPLDTIWKGIERLAEHTGKIGLISAAAGNHPQIAELCARLRERHLEVAFSSLRVDHLPDCLLDTLVEGGARTLTLAPEVGSDSLRRSVNKLFTDAQYLETVERVFARGIKNIRMYAMIGLPGEREEHLEALVDLAMRTRRLQVAGGHGEGKITLSVGQFIPKPFTPYQWSPMLERAAADKRFNNLERALAKIGGVHYAGESSKWALIQGLLSRGDRRYGQVLREVYLDNSIAAWKRALKKAGLDWKKEAYAQRSVQDCLPWDHLGGQFYKGRLEREFRRSQAILQDGATE